MHSISDLYHQLPKPPIRTQGGVFGAGDAYRTATGSGT